MTIALICGTRVAVGGLGLQAATAMHALAALPGALHVIARGFEPRWPVEVPGRATMHLLNPPTRRIDRYPPFRRFSGARQYREDVWLGTRALGLVRPLAPECIYTFTQVGLEVLRWAKSEGTPTVLDNPNGHIARFADILRRESLRWQVGRFRGHPTPEMVDRVEEEYRLADRIRVSSIWAKQCMVARGVPADKIAVFPQILQTARFRPPPTRAEPTGPLRVVFVGSLDLRKGYQYLLEAIRRLGAGRVTLHLVGATGDRGNRRLFERLGAGLDIRQTTGDPVPAYHAGEVFVLPSLEDGFGFVTAEAMACGLPAIVTDQCGSQELIEDGSSGWVIPAGNSRELAEVLRAAAADRAGLRAMGVRAADRLHAGGAMGEANSARLAAWVCEGYGVG